MSMGTELLVERILRGEADALGQLYDQLNAPIYRLAWQLTSSAPAAEHITGAVFMAAWRAPHVLARHRHRLLQHLLHHCYLAAVAWQADHPSEGSHA